MSEISIQNLTFKTIDTDLLLKVSKTGIKVLAYIIDERPIYHTFNIGYAVTLDKVKLINYFNKKFGSLYASTTNVNRGIKNLIDMKLLESHKTHDGGMIISDDYIINLDLLSK